MSGVSPLVVKSWSESLKLAADDFERGWKAATPLPVWLRVLAAEMDRAAEAPPHPEEAEKP